MSEEIITKVRLSLDVDGHSYGYDESFEGEELAQTTIDQLIDDYIAANQEKILEIHNLPEDEEIENPRQYVDVTIWTEGS